MAAFRNTTFRIPSLTDEDKKHKFIIGLRQEIQREVRLHPPPTFQAAVEMAERCEAVDKAVQRSFGNRV